MVSMVLELVEWTSAACRPCALMQSPPPLALAAALLSCQLNAVSVFQEQPLVLQLFPPSPGTAGNRWSVLQRWATRSSVLVAGAGGAPPLPPAPKKKKSRRKNRG